jgi:hypothetical protein
MPCTRRQFLQTASLATGVLTGLSFNPAGAAQPKRPKVAAIITAFFYRSHAHVILENFLQPYLFNGQRTDPGVDVVSMYVEQQYKNDMSQPFAKHFGVPIFGSIDQALCLGGSELAVDGVISIGEHGDYPTNDLDQVEYPRKRFFDAITGVMRRSNRFVPLFNDKHLSFSFDSALEMYQTTQRYGIPFLAGSSVPLAQRVPAFEMPTGPIEEAISIHGGGVESYDFHALEVLQSLIESRPGGETGVASVEFLDGPALMKAADDGRWSSELLTAAMDAERARLKQAIGTGPKSNDNPSHGILVRYCDGTRAIVAAVPGTGTRWNFACRMKAAAKIHSTSYYVGPWQNRNLFKALSHSIQQNIRTGRPPYPVERTLLTTGILDAAMHSRHEQQRLETPQLAISYKPNDFRAMREMGESWKIITENSVAPPEDDFRNGTPD